MAKLLITLVKSTNKASEKQQRVVQALGLRKIGQSVLHQDNAAIRGMVKAVPHLLQMDEVEE